VTEHAFLLDLGRCIGCQACVVACKVGNDLGSGQQYIHITEQTRGTFPDLQGGFKNLRCFHCADAACVAVCPTGALFKEGGLTRLDRSACSGCGYCVVACPYGIPEMHDGRAGKCDGCAGAVAAGGEPWCVQTCPSRALEYGERSEIEAEAGRRVSALRNLHPNASIYGETQAGGLGLLVVSPDVPEALDLPMSPAPPPSVDLWQKVVQPGTLAITAATIAAAGVGAVIARRRHLGEMQSLEAAAPGGESDDAEQEHLILRYQPTQRRVHVLLASSFLVLLLTGLFLLWGPLGFLAAGGISRWLHRIGAVVYMAVPVVYLVRDREGAKQLLVESFTYDRDDWEWLKRIGRYLGGRSVDMPPQGRLNAGQKLHHAAVIVVSAGIVLSGLGLWFLKAALGLTGVAWVAMVHDGSALVLTLLLVGHLYFTFAYRAVSGMTTGYVPMAEARIEHAKWVDELEGKTAAEALAEAGK